MEEISKKYKNMTKYGATVFFTSENNAYQFLSSFIGQFLVQTKSVKVSCSEKIWPAFVTIVYFYSFFAKAWCSTGNRCVFHYCLIFFICFVLKDKMNYLASPSVIYLKRARQLFGGLKNVLQQMSEIQTPKIRTCLKSMLV